MKETYRNFARDLILAALVAALLYFAIKNLFFLIFPLFLALLFSQVIRNGFKRLRPLSEGVKKILIILSLLIFFALISLFGILLTDRLIHGANTLTDTIGDRLENLLALLENLIHKTESLISRMVKRDMDNSLWDSLPNLFRGLLQKILDSAPAWIGALISFIPRFIVSLFIFVLATYYFSCDWEKLSRPIIRKLSPKKIERIVSVKNRFLLGLKQYSKAYFLLFILTFSELFLGLTLLQIPQSGEKAFWIALIDLFPVLGCGTVLIPWALFSLLAGQTNFAIGMFLLYAILFAVRQVAEPKIVGDSIGIHPIVSLVLVLTGLSLFGFFGMILLPLLAASFAKGMETGEKENKKA